MTTSTATIDIPPASASPAAVRHMIGALLNAWGLVVADIDDAVLVIHEILMNALEHAGAEANLELQLIHADDLLRASISDGSAVHPVIQELNQTADRGRGMQIVTAISERWGAEDHHGGKRVWVQIHLGRTASRR
jgi:anti-sigma regulatory factor (Ser/Thr protein kinase)